jgi:hypothetical protein
MWEAGDREPRTLIGILELALIALPIVASSERDFDTAQGLNDWHHGYYDGDGQGEGDANDPAGPTRTTTSSVCRSSMARRSRAGAILGSHGSPSAALPRIHP